MTFEQYKVRDPLQVTEGDAVNAAFDLAGTSTAMGVGAQSAAIGGFGSRVIDGINQAFSDGVPFWPKGWKLDAANMAEQGAKKISPEEAKKRYPDFPTPWTEPVDPYVAQMTYDKFLESNKLQALMDAGPKDAWTKLKSFGAGLLAHAMDPVELGAGMIAGWGVGAVVAKTAWGAATSGAIKAGTAGFAARTTMQAIEGVSGNLIQSAALEVGAAGVKAQEGQPVDLHEGMQQVAINTFFGSLFHMGIKEAGFLIGGANRSQRLVRNTSPEADVAIARGAFSQVERGIKLNPEVMLETLAKETSVQGEIPVQVGNKKFYVPAEPTQAFDHTQVRPVGDQVGAHIGEGTVKMTDNPHMAGAAANRAMADSPGKVFEVEAAALNPIDLHEPLPIEAVEPFKKAMEGVYGKLTDAEFNSLKPVNILKTLWDHIDAGEISEAAITTLQDDLKAKGFNAFQGDGTNVFGHEHAPHADLTVFDHTILKETNSFDASKAPRNDPSPEIIQKEIDRQNDPGQKLGMDQKIVDGVNKKIFEADAAGLTKVDNLQFLEDSRLAQVEHLQGLEKQNLLEPYERAELDTLLKMEKEPEIYKTLAKALGGCIGKHG